ncbi:glycoside hydrolase family 26 protein [Lolliginicoccus suaedae]|uniref:glycoside hydrolase family 26 protein n=1 Tax=Lolliginicoccus suaedae TaxID=2605429 RepID=UPI001659194C|nr:glycosyl hydrolase [Lolliginicoccus suaedae]
MDSSIDLSAILNRNLDVVNFYEAWEWRREPSAEILDRIHGAGATPSITWEPWNPAAGIEQPRYRLAAIARGEHDPYIETWARVLAADGRPLYMRFAHEMNGDWYPWATTTNSNDPQDYREAFQHVRSVFDSAGATNVQWVWSPNVHSDGDSGGQHDLVRSFPGNKYVDIIGLDGYAVADGGAWSEPAQLFGPAIDTARAIAPDIPIWIYETGADASYGDKAAWMDTLVEYLRAEGVEGLLLFDFAKRFDWRIEQESGTVDALRDALATW